MQMIPGANSSYPAENFNEDTGAGPKFDHTYKGARRAHEILKWQLIG
jgi:hypothetical protein